MANALQYPCLENPPDKEAWQATVYRVARLDMTEVSLHTQTQDFVCGSSAPVRVGHEAGTTAWLVGTAVAPSVQGHGLHLPQELRPSQSLFLSLSQLAIRKPLWPVFLCKPPVQALRGLPCLRSFSAAGTYRSPWLGSFSADRCLRHLKGQPGWGPRLWTGASVT